MNRDYWECSKFADWLRGTPKGGAKSGEEWDSWTDEAQAKHTVRFWLAEEGLGMLERFIKFPMTLLHEIKYWITNRFVTSTHALTSSSLRPGQWHEFDTRVLHCLFDELINFVEIEKAWHSIAWDDEARAKYKPPFFAVGFLRTRTWRCPEAGLAHLNWESSLRFNDEWVDPTDPNYDKPTYQAKTAIEVIELYNWWKVVRPARPDPMDASGWSALCDKYRTLEGRFRFGSAKSKAEQRESKKSLTLLQKIEAQYDKEDDQMLIRLIKIRKSLWT